MNKKIHSTKGEARLVVIMALIVLVLAFTAIVPAVLNMGQKKLRDLDNEYVSAAELLAKKSYLEDYEPFTAVYDSEGRRLADIDEAETIKGYANADINKEKYIIVNVNEAGEISCEWMDLGEIKALETEE